MKKSTNKPEKLPEDPEELQKEIMGDINKVFNFVNSLDNLDVDNIDTDKLKSSVKILKNSIIKKYKSHIPKKYLDSKK